MPQNAALARKWIKFNDDGTRGDTRIESANIEVIPPMAITKVVDGNEIMQTIPAHYVDDAEQGAVYVPEQTVGTGTFEKVTKVVGQTPEQYASKINADGTFEPFALMFGIWKQASQWKSRRMCRRPKKNLQCWTLSISKNLTKLTMPLLLR